MRCGSICFEAEGEEPLIQCSSSLFFGIVVFIFGVDVSAQNEMSEQGRQDDACAVGSEISPFARARFGAVFLRQFDDAAHQDGGDDGPQDDFACLFAVVAAEIFNPDDGAGAEIHRHVHNLVDVLNLFEPRVWRFEEAEIPREDNAEAGQRIPLQEAPGKCCKILFCHFGIEWVINNDCWKQ